MSTLRNPVGPQSPKVYRRRRLVLALGLLAVIIIVVLIIVRPGSGASDDKNGSSSASPSGTAAPPSATPQAEGSACLPANVTVEAVTDKDSYAAGEFPQINMTITNVGSVACILNVNPDQQLLTVSSGAEKYWVSSDCQAASTVVDPLLFKPNEPQSTAPIAWDRTRSDPATCEATRSPVPAGGASYHLTVKLGEIESTETRQFILN